MYLRVCVCTDPLSATRTQPVPAGYVVYGIAIAYTAVDYVQILQPRHDEQNDLDSAFAQACILAVDLPPVKPVPVACVASVHENIQQQVHSKQGRHNRLYVICTRQSSHLLTKADCLNMLCIFL